VPTIFFNDLGVSCLAGEKMISTKFRRNPQLESEATKLKIVGR
jgi:hypothetical protein